LWLDNRSTSGNQVNDEDNHGDYKQQVNEASCDVQTEPEEPKDEQDYEYCPEHRKFPFWKNTRKDVAIPGVRISTGK